jgi:hypothetical protein
VKERRRWKEAADLGVFQNGASTAHTRSSAWPCAALRMQQCSVALPTPMHSAMFFLHSPNACVVARAGRRQRQIT